MGVPSHLKFHMYVNIHFMLLQVLVAVKIAFDDQ